MVISCIFARFGCYLSMAEIPLSLIFSSLFPHMLHLNCSLDAPEINEEVQLEGIITVITEGWAKWGLVNKGNRAPRPLYCVSILVYKPLQCCLRMQKYLE